MAHNDPPPAGKPQGSPLAARPAGGGQQRLSAAHDPGPAGTFLQVCLVTRVSSKLEPMMEMFAALDLQPPSCGVVCNQRCSSCWPALHAAAGYIWCNSPSSGGFLIGDVRAYYSAWICNRMTRSSEVYAVHTCMGCGTSSSLHDLNNRQTVHARRGRLSICPPHPICGPCLDATLLCKPPMRAAAELLCAVSLADGWAMPLEHAAPAPDQRLQACGAL